jgi:DNA-binding XRE family transcriptional regulator
MIAIKPQTIRSPSGDELVVLTRAEFDALASAAADALEDADDVAIFDERMAALTSGLDAPLPIDVTAAMLHGQSLLRALRGWRNLTQKDLAALTGLAQGYISDLEKNRKTGSVETQKSLAKALDIDSSWLGV